MCNLCRSPSRGEAGTAPRQPPGSIPGPARPPGHRSRPLRCSALGRCVFHPPFLSCLPNNISLFIKQLQEPPLSFAPRISVVSHAQQPGPGSAPPNTLPQHAPPSFPPCQRRAEHFPLFKQLIIPLQLCRNQLITPFVLAMP